MLICRLSFKRVHRPLALVGIAGLFAVACGDDGSGPDPIPADGGSTSATASAAVTGTASAKPTGSTSASAKPTGSTSAVPTTSPADGGDSDGGPITTGDASDDGGSSTSDAGADDDSSTPETDAAASSSSPFQFPDAGPCGAVGEQCCTALGGMGGGMGGGGAGTCDEGLVCDLGGQGTADNLCAVPAPVPDTGTADTGAGEVDAAVEADAGDGGDAGACGGSGQVCCAFTGPGTRCEDGTCSGGFCP